MPRFMDVGYEVTFAQYLAVILALATQTDILTSIQTVLLLKNDDHVPWDKVIGEEGNRSRYLWVLRILLPNILKFIQASVVLFASFVIIIQSERIIDLLKDITAVLIVSQADNILFSIADMGYLGADLAQKTAEAKKVCWKVVVVEGDDPTKNTYSCHCYNNCYNHCCYNNCYYRYSTKEKIQSTRIYLLCTVQHYDWRLDLHDSGPVCKWWRFKEETSLIPAMQC